MAEAELTGDELAIRARDDMRGALDSIKRASDAYVFDGEPAEGRTSGAPERRELVFGGEDERDAAIAEKPLMEESVFRGLIFDVNRMDVELPDGRRAQRDIVRHPGAVAIVALTDDGRICLVRQYRPSLGRVTVEIPAGKLDPGEDPLVCATRELEEETGLNAERIAYLTTIATTPGFTDELIHFYMATGLSLGESHPDADEFLNIDLVELPELVDAVLDGRIEDAKTVIGALICDAVSRRLESEE